MDNLCNLTNKRCKPCAGNIPPLTQPEVDSLMLQLKQWQQDKQLISKTFHFNNYYETMSFVNAVAWLSHREDHHPDLTVTYKDCLVVYTTHAISGLSENDFICAAKVDTLFKL